MGCGVPSALVQVIRSLGSRAAGHGAGPVQVTGRHGRTVSSPFDPDADSPLVTHVYGIQPMGAPDSFIDDELVVVDTFPNWLVRYRNVGR